MAISWPCHATGGAAPHWSRWGKDATTFGPRGRVGITVTLVLFLVIGAFTQFLLLWLVEVIVGAWILKDVWRPAWVVPGEDAQARRPLRPDGRVADWLFDRDELVRAAAGVIVALGIGVAIMTGPPVVRFVTIFGVVILGGYLFFRNGSLGENRPHASPRPPKRRERFWKSRIASYRYSRLKSGQNTGVNQSSE
jgi:hypothetical protein